MSGMEVFNGPALFAITHSSLDAITQFIWSSGPRSQRLVKSKSPIEANKWRYIFEAGLTIWGKSGIDLDKLGQAMEKSDDGRSGRSKEDHASDDGMDVDLRDDPVHQSIESATSESGQRKKVATLRGGSGRADSVVDIQRPRRATRRNIDYRLLDHGVDSGKNVTQTANEERPKKVRRTRPSSTSPSGSHSAHTSQVLEGLLASASKDNAQLSTESLHPRKAAQLPEEPEETLSLSKLDTEDDLDLEFSRPREEEWINSGHIARYGMSDEWRAKIDQAFQPALAEVQRQQRIWDELIQGQIDTVQAQNQLCGTHGLRFQSSSESVLGPENSQAAKVLGGSLAHSRRGTGNAGTDEASAENELTLPSLEVESHHFGTDAWLSTSMHLDQLFEGSGGH
ncbi:uncharacterized protein M421DRAFT_4147 [Didymella exigua CBS 183.55]|uniref:Uncharacterized protein n=1 Tax=Didymella exigua CBS 183.55 TaxID=1150837 RepID=A0A6A5RRA5_9PLEO|nr:uncharacterized protein M421DRAFT_4147 [Didymella exigua CBS 183.55]KAF1929698.1 hypothetical protein M421DRAFT_4147 [Didymella exigua CBS 183.55]